MKNRKNLLWVLFAFWRFGFLCSYNLGEKKENLNAEEVNPKTLVSLSDIYTQFSWIKTWILLEPDEVKVHSEAKGQVKSISFPIGSEVHHGQPVLQLEDVFYLYTQGLDEAQTAYDTAQYQYDTRKTDSQKELSLIEQEIKSLNTQMATLEDQIFTLSEVTPEKQEQKKQEALQKNQEITTNLQQLWQHFMGEISLVENLDFPFFQDYFSSLSTLSNNFTQGDFVSQIQQNTQFISKFSDFCYLLQSAWVENELLSSSLQKLKEEQNKLHSLQSDFASFFSDTFQTEKQNKIANLSQQIEDTESDLNQKNLDYELQKNAMQEELHNLSNNLDRARATYNAAYVSVNKLTSRSPQEGLIKNFFVQVGDFVEVGTPLFSLDVSKNSQIQVSLSFDELLALSGITECYLDILNQSGALTTLTWTILSHSSVADDQGNYTLLISLPQKLDSFFTVVYLSFPLHSDFSFLPQEMFHETSSTSGSFYGYLSGKEEKFEVPLGISRNWRREVLTWLDENLLFEM